MKLLDLFLNSVMNIEQQTEQRLVTLGVVWAALAAWWPCKPQLMRVATGDQPVNALGADTKAGLAEKRSVSQNNAVSQ